YGWCGSVLMTWHGWLWTGTAWFHACVGDDQGQCHRGCPGSPMPVKAPLQAAQPAAAWASLGPPGGWPGCGTRAAEGHFDAAGELIDGEADFEHAFTRMLQGRARGDQEQARRRI